MQNSMQIIVQIGSQLIFSVLHFSYHSYKSIKVTDTTCNPTSQSNTQKYLTMTSNK